MKEGTFCSWSLSLGSIVPTAGCSTSPVPEWWTVRSVPQHSPCESFCVALSLWVDVRRMLSVKPPCRRVWFSWLEQRLYYRSPRAPHALCRPMREETQHRTKSQYTDSRVTPNYLTVEWCHYLTRGRWRKPWLLWVYFSALNTSTAVCQQRNVLRSHHSFTSALNGPWRATCRPPGWARCDGPP